MKLQNTVMQLRKVCSHPFLFDWPLDPVTREPVANEQLVNASGKMMVLDRLLSELFKRGHKVLLFSQFTTMLDVIEVNTASTSTSLRLTTVITQRNGPTRSSRGRLVVSMGRLVHWSEELR